MPTLQTRIEKFGRDFGRKLTPDERRLTRWWYEAFEAKKNPKKTAKRLRKTRSVRG